MSKDKSIQQNQDYSATPDSAAPMPGWGGWSTAADNIVITADATQRCEQMIEDSCRFFQKVPTATEKAAFLSLFLKDRGSNVCVYEAGGPGHSAADEDYDDDYSDPGMAV